jgi:HD-like signal output (HDOD) protein
MMQQSRHTQTEPEPATGPSPFRDAILGLLRILEEQDVDLEAVARVISRDPRLSKLPHRVDPARFWSFALATGVCARTLARDLGYTDPERALRAGLLHRLGVLLVAGAQPERFARALELAEATHIETDEALECEFGTPHPELCARALRSGE